MTTATTGKTVNAKKKRRATHCGKVGAMRVYAYGVKPLYGGPDGEHFQELPDGLIVLWQPYAFLHYWIDDSLAYHECSTDSSAMLEIQWVNDSRRKVELRGPNDYTVTFR